MTKHYKLKRQKKTPWFKYLFLGHFLKSTVVKTTIVSTVGCGIIMGYTIGSIDETDDGTVIIGTELLKKEFVQYIKGQEEGSFVSKVKDSLSKMRGLKWETQPDGRIKVMIPYKRDVIEEHENYEHGENEFIITPSNSGEMVIEQKTKRYMAIYGYSEEKGTGKVYISQEGVTIKMRDREAVIKVPDIMKKMKGQNWQNFEVEWKGTPGARMFRYQTIETDENGNVIVRDCAPGAKTDPSGSVIPVMRKSEKY